MGPQRNDLLFTKNERALKEKVESFWFISVRVSALCFSD